MPQTINIWLIVFVICAVVITALLAVAFSLAKRFSERMIAIESKLGIAAEPFWQYGLRVLAELLTHPHKRYAEMDLLIKEALLEPVVKMDDDRFARLDVLLQERSQDTSDDMREGEQDAALIFLKFIYMVRREAASTKGLSSYRVIGRQEPEAQSDEEPEIIKP
jgi:hypothetical protein